MWRVNFFDRHGDETRSLTVDADSEDTAESAAEEEANSQGWPQCFKIADAECLDTPNAEHHAREE